MDGHERLVLRVAAEQDDVLDSIQLIDDGDRALQDRLFEQLVDLLVEAMFLSLRRDYLDGTLPKDAYVDTLTRLADRCRQLGLLPLPSRHR